MVNAAIVLFYFVYACAPPGNSIATAAAAYCSIETIAPSTPALLLCTYMQTHTHTRFPAPRVNCMIQREPPALKIY
jgi:hypothetical protein